MSEKINDNIMSAIFGKYEPCNNYAGYFFFRSFKAYFFATLKLI
jgi:hypothetical protein